MYITDKHLSTATFSDKDIGNVIQNLDSNKAHRHDNMYPHAKNMESFYFSTVRDEF